MSLRPSGHVALICALICALAACSSSKPVVTATLPVEQVTPVEPPRSGVDMAGMDTSVRPQDDFYAYVNGAWMRDTKLPGDRSDFGVFTALADEAEVQLHAIVEELTQDQTLMKGTPGQKIRDYYTSYVSATEQPDVHLGDLRQNELAKIDAIATHEDFYEVMGELTPIYVTLPLAIRVRTDLKNPEQMNVYLSQSGLTLPDRDYYLKDEANYLEARRLFTAYADQMLAFGEYAPAGEALLAFETKLAEISWSREQRRDPTTQYNPHSVEQLAKLADKAAWKAYLSATQVPMRAEYIVSQPSYVAALADVIAATPVETLKSYLRFQVLSDFSSVLGKPAADASFAFYSKGLRGVGEQREPWKRAIDNLNGSMGELLGQLYVERHFRPEAKVRMSQMVALLLDAYRVSIDELDWMSDGTRTRALQKVNTFTPKIGYPDAWRDYTNLQLGTDAIDNARRIARYSFHYYVDKLDRPIDKREWGMPPQRVNAYYNPQWNEIVFPAAILQPPFFDLQADDAVNYGAIGAVIGHEIGHGFDDQGRKFDSLGAMNDWWTSEDAAAFEAKKEALKAQYDAFEVIGGKTINGEFTSGENIGDLAGLSIAYRAYTDSLMGKPAPVIDGFTGEQRFFIGWAQVWRRLYTDAELERRLVVDPHSPSRARVNVVVRNLPAFYRAFDVKPGDGMYLAPEQRVKIW